MAFEVIPAIDLRGGKCVRLFQGDFARETVYGDDPAAMARRWRGEGAGRLHVVDLEGARTGIQVNLASVSAIAEAAGVPVQAGGGARSLETVEALLAAGVSRVVIGTAAVEDEAFVAEAGGTLWGRNRDRRRRPRREGRNRGLGAAAAGRGRGPDRADAGARRGGASSIRTFPATGALTGPNVEALSSAH